MKKWNVKIVIYVFLGIGLILILVWISLAKKFISSYSNSYGITKTYYIDKNKGELIYSINEVYAQNSELKNQNEDTVINTLYIDLSNPISNRKHRIDFRISDGKDYINWYRKSFNQEVPIPLDSNQSMIEFFLGEKLDDKESKTINSEIQKKFIDKINLVIVPMDSINNYELLYESSDSPWINGYLRKE